MGLEQETETGITTIVCREIFDVPIKNDPISGRKRFMQELEERGWKKKGGDVALKNFYVSSCMGVDQEGNNYVEYRAILNPGGETPFHLE